MNGQYREALQRAQWYMAQGTHSQLAEAFLQADRWKQERDTLQRRVAELEAALRQYADPNRWESVGACEWYGRIHWRGGINGWELAKSALEGKA